LIFFIHFFSIFSGYIKCTKINLIYYADENNADYIDFALDQINSYLEKNNFNITLEKNTYNSATTIESYTETMEYLLNTKSTKFDMIIIDTVDSKRFTNHLLNLNEALPSDVMDKYNNGIAKDLYYINGETHAIVIILF